jgi:2-dehydro-3-deoxy-D-arabinonate dehydratase
MNLCRFEATDGAIRIGLVTDGRTLLDLSTAGVVCLTTLLESPDCRRTLAALTKARLPRIALRRVRLLAPVERQEVWAAGVTYLRSKRARMDESDFSASAYDRVYEADRPEIFFKSMPEKVVAPGDAVGIRKDARWNVPEPELALVLNSRGQIAGYTIGNDMSARDIEGENLLYLPQAKVYDRSCAVGPWVRVGVGEAQARRWTIELDIRRGGRRVFHGRTGVSRIRRSFAELAGYLFRSQRFPNGAVLLTGTGIVPADEFTLQAGDRVRITISGIGSLQNPVVVV